MADLAEIDTRARNLDDAATADLNRRFENSGTRRLIETLLAGEAGKRTALVSSFGANSVVLLHLAASIDPSLPVLFIDTGKLFADTNPYREELTHRLGLKNVRVVSPSPARVAERDPNGALWITDAEACCAMRKVEPLAEALAGFDIWLSGRKRYQGGGRADLPLFELDHGRGGPRLKVNPLAAWTAGDIDIYRNAFSLPQHPLVARGYRSIGCEPCTSPVAGNEDERTGRWRGLDKTECGIHVPDHMGGLP